MEVLYNFNTSNVFIYHMAEWTGYPPEDNFNTSNVFVYETRNHGFMRSVRPFRQITDKLPASNRALRLLSPLFLRSARLPAGPLHYL